MANEEQIKIDVQEFAKLIIGANPQRKNEDETRYIKRQLKLYLETLVIIGDFNQLEAARFAEAKGDQREQILQKIMERRY